MIVQVPAQTLQAPRPAAPGPVRPTQAQALAGLPLPALDEWGWPKWPERGSPPAPNLDQARMERVLRDGGDSGQIRLALLQWTLAWEPFWLFPRRDVPPPPGRPTFRVPEAWAGLTRFEDWPWQVDLGAAPLGPPLAKALGEDPLNQAFDAVLAALAQDPARARLQENLAFLHRVTARDRLDARCAQWEAIAPLPDQAWPPLPMARAHLDQLIALERVSEVRDKVRRWVHTPDPRFLTPARWTDHLQREAVLHTYSQIAATRQAQTGQRILEGITAIHGFGGPDFQALAGFFLRNLPQRLLAEQDALFHQELKRLLGKAPQPFPPMPAPPPPWDLRVTTPALKAAFQTMLDMDPDLRTWLPGEVRLAVVPGSTHPVELWLGPERRHMWGTAPPAETLADALASARGGRLRAAMDQINRMGPSPGRRAFRIPLLLARLPLQGLQDLLVEDLMATLNGTTPPGGTVPEDFWATAAGQVIPELERHLRAWPLDTQRWEALAFWTARLPSHLGPSLAAQGRPEWQEGLPFVLGLPPALHQRVGERLAEAGAWRQARAWFEPAWEALGQLDPKAWQTWPWVAELIPVIRGHLGKAYGKLGQEGLRQALNAQRVGPLSGSL